MARIAATKKGTGEVMEGFLCPVCLQDLTSITQLQVHFEEEHAAEDSAVLNSIKSIFSKAKKLLNDSDDEADGASGDVRTSLASSKLFSNPFGSPSPASALRNSYDPWSWDPPDRGPQRSHTSLFKNIRSDRIDAYVAETNKLLLRLDKLLTDIPTDPVKRKAHERRLVPWVQDEAVPLCPDCGRSFSALTRRRHHCRLCGAVLCSTCSTFLSMAFAKKLVAPVHVASMGGGESSSHQRSPSRGGSVGGLSVPGFGGLRRSGSQSSLNSLVSMMDSLTGEQHFRVCKHCHQRISARDHAIELRQSRPLLSLLYTKLMTDRTRLQQLLPQYKAMADSLWAGESAHQLRDAAELRMKLVRLGDSINATSQKITTLGPVYAKEESQQQEPGQDPPTAPGPRQSLLQRRIQQSAATFLKAHVLGIDKLPDAQHLQQLQAARREESARRLMAEREAAELAEQRAEQTLQRLHRQREADSGSRGSRERTVKDSSQRTSASPGHRYRPAGNRPHNSSSRHGSPHPGAAVVGEEGWGGDSDAHLVTATDDPVIQQMNIIRNYIRQARDACRYDEVKTLETNLKELQEEYKRQLNEKL